MTDPKNTSDTPTPDNGATSKSETKGSRIRLLRSPSDAIKPDAVPPPPPLTRRERREQGSLVNIASNFLTFFVVISLVIVGGFQLVKKEFDAPGPLAADKIVVVKGGTQTVTETLRREGIIDQPTLFITGLHLFGASDDLKAGEYLFKQHASLRDVMDTLRSGKPVQHALTIPEGLTSEQIVSRLLESDLLTGSIKDTPPEGSLLPETYKIARGAPRQQILDRMRADSKRVVAEIWANRSTDIPVKTPLELVTLASIVEKETGKADERPEVAGVFVNRLQKRMRLQSDPTIVYGLVGGKGTLGRPILRSEITRPTPYNTYVIDGLPPGPIANPGRAALEAVANPARTKNLYFVADGTGGHTFSETLDQHNRSVGRWRKIEAERKNDADEKASAPGPASGAGAPAAADRVPASAVDQAPPAVQRPRAFDASEGTPNDPLLNKTYDLNSMQTVPKLR